MSKKLDSVVAVWPVCLGALVATVLLIKEADKLTLGQKLNVKVPHMFMSLMNTQGYHFLTSSRLTQQQRLFCENPSVTLQTVRTLNPATFLPTEEGERDHDFSEVTDESRARPPGLRDQAIKKPGDHPVQRPVQQLTRRQPKSRVRGNHNYQSFRGQGITEGWSAQRAELYALTRALIHSKGK